MHAFLRNTDWIELQKLVYTVDFSAGMPAHHSMYWNFDALSSQVLPHLVEAGIASAEMLERMRQQAVSEMLLDDFCALWPLFVLSAKKLELDTANVGGSVLAR